MTENPILKDDLALANERTADSGLSDRMVLPIVEERLRIDKRTEETGVVRIHKNVTERSETVRFETTDESVVVERVPVDRIVEGPVETRQEGDTTVIPVLEEVVVVEKRLRLIEEVRITRTRTTAPNERTVVLRKEEVVVERETPNP